jgi:hypothetical protein
MSILANLENAAASLGAAETLINKIKADSRSAMDPKTFIKENTKKVIATLRKDLANNATERTKILLENCGKAQSKLDAYMRPARTGTENLHFMRAERITRAQTAEEARGTYKRNVARLTADELKNVRYIYDDALFEAIAMIEPAAEYLADMTIDEFRGDIEKYYREGVKLEYETYDQLKEITGLIESQIADLEAGESPTKYNWAKVLNEATDNARHNVRGASPMPEVKINPYDSESELENESEGESEAV